MERLYFLHFKLIKLLKNPTPASAPALQLNRSAKDKLGARGRPPARDSEDLAQRANIGFPAPSPANAIGLQERAPLGGEAPEGAAEQRRERTPLHRNSPCGITCGKRGLVPPKQRRSLRRRLAPFPAATAAISPGFLASKGRF